MRRALPHILFAVITLVLFWRFIFLGQSLYSVILLEAHMGAPRQRPPTWFKPHRVHSRVADTILFLPTQLKIYNDGLKSGELRLWNPYLFCGYPLYANPMIHPFYPPNLILHATLPPDAAYETNLMLHLFFSGAAMFWLLRELKRSDAAATAGAVVWMLLGYSAMWFSTGILLGAGVWAPLALLWIVQGLERKDVSRASLAALAMGMTFLGSHPQHAIHVFFFLLAWVAVSAMRDRALALRFGATFAALAVGAGLAAILTRLETIELGNRVAGSDVARLYAEPMTTLSYALGLALGKIHFPESSFLEHELTAYAGLAALTLAIVGAVRSFREPAFRFAAVFGAVALLAAFVKPAAAVLDAIPILNLSPPSRWLYVAGFCMALLAARGLDALRENPGKVPHVLAAATILLLATCLIGIGPFRLTNAAAIETLIGFALCVAAAFAARRHPRAAYGLALGALLFELFPFFIHFNYHADPKIAREIPEPVRYANEREKGRPWRAGGLLGSAYPPGSPRFEAALSNWNNLLSLYGVEGVAGFEAIVPASYARFAAAAGAEGTTSGRSIRFADYHSPLLDATGLKYVFLPFEAEMPKRFRLVEKWGSIHLYENRSVLPRAWMVSRIHAARNEEDAERLLRSPGFDPREGVILETSATAAPGGAVRSTISWSVRETDRFALDVDAEADGMLVVADTDYPGWEATVDGKPVPIHRANVAFRAIEVPRGKHLVEFRFRPESARNGLIGSTLFMLLALGHGIWRRKGRPVS